MFRLFDPNSAALTVRPVSKYCKQKTPNYIFLCCVVQIECPLGRKLIEVCGGKSATEDDSKAAVAAVLKKHGVLLALGLLDSSVSRPDYRFSHVASLPSREDFSTFPIFWGHADIALLELVIIHLYFFS